VAQEETGRAREVVREFERRIECFRWVVHLCMDIKREYWLFYLECLYMASPGLEEPVSCRERALDRVMARFDFLSRDAIMDCIIS
jgi:hypothetical protein